METTTPVSNLIELHDPYDPDLMISHPPQDIVSYYYDELLDEPDDSCTIQSIADFCNVACANSSRLDDPDVYKFRIEALASGCVEFTTVEKGGESKPLDLSSARVLASTLRDQLRILRLLYESSQQAFEKEDISPESKGVFIFLHSVFNMPIQLEYATPNIMNPNMGLNQLMHIDEAFETLVCKQVAFISNKYTIEDVDHQRSFESMVLFTIFRELDPEIAGLPQNVMNPFPKALYNYIHFREYLITTLLIFLEDQIRSKCLELSVADHLISSMKYPYPGKGINGLYFLSQNNDTVPHTAPSSVTNRRTSTSKQKNPKVVHELVPYFGKGAFLPRWAVEVMTISFVCFYFGVSAA